MRNLAPSVYRFHPYADSISQSIQRNHTMRLPSNGIKTFKTYHPFTNLALIQKLFGYHGQHRGWIQHWTRIGWQNFLENSAVRR